MSKGGFSGQPPLGVEPAEQVRFFADSFRNRITRASRERFLRRVLELGLEFTEDELTVLAALDTPERVQEFLNTELYYNNDHATPETEETALSPRQVLHTAKAHCFEGAMFAYAVNYLHGHEPRLVMLEASQDSDHNLVLYQDPRTKLYGVNAHSAFPNLDGRPARYSTIREIAESYYPYYYSDRTRDPRDLTLVGFSDPFDLVPKFGTKWIGSLEPLWDIYYTYIDDTVAFHYLFDDTQPAHLYPLIGAIKERWIEVGTDRKPIVNDNNFDPKMRELWINFWQEYGTQTGRPDGRAREIEKDFQKLSRTTPIDLVENAGELESFLLRGYDIRSLLTRG